MLPCTIQTVNEEEQYQKGVYRYLKRIWVKEKGNSKYVTTYKAFCSPFPKLDYYKLSHAQFSKVKFPTHKWHIHEDVKLFICYSFVYFILYNFFLFFIIYILILF